MLKLKLILVTIVAMALAACGGGSDNTLVGGGGGGGGVNLPVNSLSLVSSDLQIPSDGSVDAMITVIARDANNNVMEGVSVVFSADSGSLVVAQPSVTDATGRITAVLSTLGDPALRTITVTVTAGGQTSTVTVDVVNAITIGTLTLISSSPQILSDGTNDAILTAIIRDTNNTTLPNIPVVFSADSGSLSVASPAVTDTNGQVTAVLSTLGNPQNRTITVTATADTFVANALIDVVGTTLDLNGPASLALGDTAAYNVVLLDAGGNGIGGQSIDITSDSGNSISATPLTTDGAGQAGFTLMATVAGPDTLNATGLGLIGPLTLNVTSDAFAFTDPAPNTEIPLNTPQTVTVNWMQVGVPVAGQPVTFSTTRGTVSAAQVNTDGAGNATITIMASNAGPAVITATNSSGTSTQIVVEFVATTPATIDLQANPFTVGPQEQSAITAVVRDATGNLVKNQIVNFTLDDVTNGSLSVGQAITDSQGRAQTFYTASISTSAADGVIVAGTVQGTAISDSVALTVAQRELFLSIGTGNEIFEPNSAQYRVEYIVQVTDSQGNGVENVTVQVNVLSIQYMKGFRAVPLGQNAWTTVITATCADEDVNRNGQLDPAEDFNSSGQIEAGNIATVSVQGLGGGTFSSDENGFGLLDLFYPQEYAYYLRVTMEATTAVQGTEFAESTTFTVTGAASDFNNALISPPGPVSPFGQSATCADTN